MAWPWVFLPPTLSCIIPLPFSCNLMPCSIVMQPCIILMHLMLNWVHVVHCFVHCIHMHSIFCVRSCILMHTQMHSIFSLVYNFVHLCIVHIHLYIGTYY